MHADLDRIAPSFFRIGLFLLLNTNLSCNFSRGVLTILVFALHPDSLMQRAARVPSQVECLLFIFMGFESEARGSRKTSNRHQCESD